MKSIPFTSLPDDMQELISCYFDNAGIDDVPALLPLRQIPLALFPDVALADGLIDTRGQVYAQDMMHTSGWLPPVVVHGDSWMDGRHRVWASKQVGRLWTTAIDLKGLIPDVSDGLVSPVIRELFPAEILSLQEHCALYAEPYLDSAPESIGAYGQSDDINQLQWLVCTLNRAGLQKICANNPVSGLLPEFSDLTRPIILSLGDAVNDEDEFMLWDGHHRAASAWVAGGTSIPVVFGLPKDMDCKHFYKHFLPFIAPCKDADVVQRIISENQLYGAIDASDSLCRSKFSRPGAPH